MTFRSQRAGNFIREELTLLLQTELEDPRLIPLTITDVDVTKDRRLARVYVTAMSSEGDLGEADLQEGLEGLERAKPVMRRRLAEVLSWPFIPDLDFRPDLSWQHGQRIDALLAQIRDERVERETDGEAAASEAPGEPDGRLE